ncbi:Golgi-associated plant pathogenesis-related protein 1-like isoform X1 [Metopolophium dirhodum]|uniref:Golgi-associated plant pathogenesis-related protein 1-like isoform X1 n=1 Tax=Metopolophium dirhodum TaxID=44670 RepID=UPI00298F9D66|nr:Golgi-associated plant pathogenesis-related protein 1-like isoform X1 [Metopolophium dirhodum]
MAVNIDDSETKNVITEALDRHNFYRKKHNVPPLKINSKLNDISQNWADELAKRDVASHRPNNAYGENIYTIKSTEQVTELGTKAVNSWYNEIKFFDFQGSNNDMAACTKSFHFTQLIWKDSSELGVGASKSSKSGKLYVVCNYDPHGNIRSQFKDQVLQASG